MPRPKPLLVRSQGLDARSGAGDAENLQSAGTVQRSSVHGRTHDFVKLRPWKAALVFARNDGAVGHQPTFAAITRDRTTI
jgi:hypothetical protein